MNNTTEDKQLSPIRLEVSVSKAVHCLGEVMNGKISVQSSSVCAIGSLSVLLLCEGHSDFVRHRSHLAVMTDSDGTVYPVDGSEYYKEVHNGVIHKTPPVVVYGRTFEDRQGLSPNQPLNFPFQLTLPSLDLSSSLPPLTTKPYAPAYMHQHFFGSSVGFQTYNSAAVAYYVQVIAQDLTGEVVATTKLETSVRSCFRYPNPEQPLKVSLSHTTFHCLCGGVKNRFTLNVTTDKTVYAPGDKMTLKYWLTSTVVSRTPTMLSLTLSFVRHVSSIPNRTSTDQDVYQPLTYSVPYTERILTTPLIGQIHRHQFTLPLSAVPSCRSKQLPNVVGWTYSLQLRLEYHTGWYSEVRCIDVPIVVNGMNAAQLAAAQALPLMQAPLPAATRMAQMNHTSHFANKVVALEPRLNDKGLELVDHDLDREVSGTTAPSSYEDSCGLGGNFTLVPVDEDGVHH